MADDYVPTIEGDIETAHVSHVLGLSFNVNLEQYMLLFLGTTIEQELRRDAATENPSPGHWYFESSTGLPYSVTRPSQHELDLMELALSQKIAARIRIHKSLLRSITGFLQPSMARPLQGVRAQARREAAEEAAALLQAFQSTSDKLQNIKVQLERDSMYSLSQKRKHDTANLVEGPSAFLERCKRLKAEEDASEVYEAITTL